MTGILFANEYPDLNISEKMNKKLKFIYYSGNCSRFQSYSFDQRTIWFAFSILVFLLLMSTFIFSFLIVKEYCNIQMFNLKSEEEKLLAQIYSIQQNLDGFIWKLRQTDKFDNDLRAMVELPFLDIDTKKFGVGGALENMEVGFELLPSTIKTRIRRVNQTLVKVEIKLMYQLQSFSEIETTIKRKKKKIRHTPTIRPLKKGRLKSKFGFRKDPFLNIICHHNGIDIAASKGTSVLCPSDGRVIKVNETRNLTKRLGKYVYIDHGFGITTIYGHLSRIAVKKGQVIKRWDKIGEVGNTGRSTGAHLHYQININEKPVDPLDFMIEW